jgi:putative endonuclease
MAAHNDLGKKAEELAGSFLSKKGYKILRTNFRVGNAEVDLIVQKDLQLIFVEVKARKSAQFGAPENFVNREKRSNMKKVARHFISLVNFQGQCRFDIVSILMTKDQVSEIKHFEDAFFLK